MARGRSEALRIGLMSNWWGTKRATSMRLQFEVKAMRRAFGNTFRLDMPSSGKHKDRICWLVKWRSIWMPRITHALICCGLYIQAIIPRHHQRLIVNSQSSSPRFINTSMVSFAFSRGEMASHTVGIRGDRRARPSWGGPFSGFMRITLGRRRAIGQAWKRAYRRI